MKRKYESLTPDKLKTFPGYENLTDQQAEVLTEQFNKLAAILVKVDIEKVYPQIITSTNLKKVEK